MTNDQPTAGPLGEAGARLRALVAKWREVTAQDAGSFVINPWNRDAGIRLCADALEAELDALLSAPVVSPNVVRDALYGLWQAVISQPVPVEDEKKVARGGNRDLQDTAVPHRKPGDK
jgi:hypothetical protein